MHDNNTNGPLVSDNHYLANDGRAELKRRNKNILRRRKRIATRNDDLPEGGPLISSANNPSFDEVNEDSPSNDFGTMDANMDLDAEDAGISIVHEGNNNISSIDSTAVNRLNSMANITVEVAELRKKDIAELLKFSEGIGVEIAVGFSKKEIIMNILREVSLCGGVVIGSGVVEILQEGFGFLRSAEANYVACSDDIYIASHQIKKFGFRTGDKITGIVRAPKRGERYFALQKVLDINSEGVTNFRYRSNFDDLVPLYPVERLNLETEENNPLADISTRIVDLVAPLGKGQRALIVAPPRTGKTMLMQNIAHAISANHPEVSLIVLLIDERPEEVTDMLRSVKGEVVSSTFDEPATRHVQLAEMVIEKAKRMVERKKDVVILLDSITRLARAYNTVIPSSGKVLTGGVDSNALQRPKRFFGAARNIEQGGSLTIIATALVETGSRMDEVIFEEFKGTGNSEIVLDRKIADKRIFPAIDITRSSTRKEELLVDRHILGKMWVLRRLLVQMAPIESIEFLRDKIKYSKNNQEFFNLMNN